MGKNPRQQEPLEKGMAAHSSIPAWEIPWTEEPGGPQCMGSQESDTTELLRIHTRHTEAATLTSLAEIQRYHL